MEELQFFEKIEAYEEGKLSTEERRQFESELEENEELKKEWDAYRATQKAVEVLAFNELKESFGNIEKETVNKVFYMNFKRIIGIAASIIFLITAIMFWYANHNYNNAKLASKYYNEPNMTAVRGSDASELFRVTADAFYRKNYDRTIDMGLNVPPNMKNHWEAQLLVGHAFLKKSKTPEALEIFNSIIEKGDERWRENAEFHRLLTHVQAGNEAQIEHFVDEILQNNTSEYTSEAISLQKDLKSFWRKLVFK